MKGPERFFRVGWVLIADDPSTSAGVALLEDELRGPSKEHFVYATWGRAAIVGDDAVIPLFLAGPSKGNEGYFKVKAAFVDGTFVLLTGTAAIATGYGGRTVTFYGSATTTASTNSMRLSWPCGTYCGGHVSSTATYSALTPLGPTCGNGKVETGEQCDDGNTASGDGCSSTCKKDVPKRVSLLSLSAQRTPEGVSLRWTTSAEVRCGRFEVLRCEGSARCAAADHEPLEERRIPCQDRAEGASYAVVDRAARASRSYSYLLREHETSGARNDYGPVVLPAHQASARRTESVSTAKPATGVVSEAGSGCALHGPGTGALPSVLGLLVTLLLAGRVRRASHHRHR